MFGGGGVDYAGLDILLERAKGGGGDHRRPEKPRSVETVSNALPGSDRHTCFHLIVHLWALTAPPVLPAYSLYGCFIPPHTA